jgi:hypothetical protein|tara:strand:+ start:534 stop:1448 length:915 start_codon:yes stop_codon:yes gene_type:complete
MARENVQTDDNEGEDLEPTPYQNDYRRNLAIDDDLDESNFQDPADMQTTQRNTEGLAQTKASKEQTHDFKKRYGDLKRHYDTKLNEWKQEKEMFQAKLAVEAKKHDIKKLPKTEEELESFKEKYPDVYDVVETISSLQASERVKDIEGRLQELRQKEQEAVVQTAEKQLLSMHPDFSNLKEDESFLNWLEDQPTNISDGIFKNNTDVKWAARVVDLFKADIGAPRNTKRTNQKANKRPQSSSPKNQAAQSVTKTTANKSLDSFQDDTKIWSIAEIARLKPKEYELLEKEIDKAHKEGRVVDSVE